MQTKPIRLIALLLALLGLYGCAANPVTHKKELVLLSESMEKDIGEKQYRPSRQMSGGDYLLDPDLSRYVRQVGNRIARISDRVLAYEFVILNNSTPNAWALPGGKIAITRGLLVELDSEAELAAVLAHEIVHAAARHGAKSAQRNLVFQGLVTAAAIAAGGSDFSVLAVGSAVVGTTLIKQAYSREDELEADYYSILYLNRAGYDPEAAVSLQEKFLEMAKKKKKSWLEGLLSTHPPTAERLEKNRETAAKLAGGRRERGVRRYREKIAKLLKTKAAYAMYDKGLAALKKGKAHKARALARRALAIEPEEALFYGLLGSALSLGGDRRAALAAFNEAIRRDPTFFRHPLERGRLHAAMGHYALARRDFNKSIDLYPTSDAHFFLGQIALREGDKKKAVALFRKAANARSESGKAAMRMLHRLDLPRHPGRYLTCYLKERGGRLHVFIKNATTVTVSNLSLVLSRNFKDKLRFKVSQKIKAGDFITVPTPVRVKSKKEKRRWYVRIERASVE